MYSENYDPSQEPINWDFIFLTLGTICQIKNNVFHKFFKRFLCNLSYIVHRRKLGLVTTNQKFPKICKKETSDDISSYSDQSTCSYYNELKIFGRRSFTKNFFWKILFDDILEWIVIVEIFSSGKWLSEIWSISLKIVLAVHNYLWHYQIQVSTHLAITSDRFLFFFRILCKFKMLS